ncbi:MAG: hypothetical protein IJX28_02010 [Clostridia bacterium]|nr:hypothetical protein [Clostridia bacterium]
MKKIQKASELLWLMGIVIVALGVAICSKADLGVSMIAAPAFVISEALAPLWSGFSVGVTEYLIQGLMLAVLCAVIRRFRWRYLLAFAVAVIYGYTLNLFLWLLNGISFDTIWLRWVMLLVGDGITAFGVACFFRTYMPLQVYELFVAELAERFHWNINKTKWTFDITLLVLSVLLAVTLFGDLGSFDWTAIGYSSFHSIGLGTLVTTAINSPLIAMMSKLLHRWFDATPRFPALEKLLKRNG